MQFPFSPQISSRSITILERKQQELMTRFGVNNTPEKQNLSSATKKKSKSPVIRHTKKSRSMSPVVVTRKIGRPEFDTMPSMYMSSGGKLYPPSGLHQSGMKGVDDNKNKISNLRDSKEKSELRASQINHERTKKYKVNVTLLPNGDRYI
jgi:hypothetical protein